MIGVIVPSYVAAYLLAELFPMPWLHTRVSESDNGGNLRSEGRDLVLDNVADVALSHLPGIVEHS